ncbi:MAG TPA: alpha/beta hydrolase [Ramlibacter sp.]|nr:alpha/beta hydrolase [Ramlibacter sp.]
MTKPVLMLLPGLLCDAAVWAGQQEALSGANCLVPDYGELSSITEMARLVLRQAPQQNFWLAGHSMGGRVALEVVRLAPERVSRLALLDTGLDPIAPGEAGATEREGRERWLQLARQEGMRAMGRGWARGMVHPDHVDTPVFEAILDMVERKTPEIYAAQIEALLNRPDARQVFAAVQCPVLLLCGRQDAWSPLARHEQMKALRPGSELVVIEDSGHMAPMEQPRSVGAALAEWLALPSAGRTASHG